MSLLEMLIGNPAATAIGWTLLHSLWEGAIVAAVLGAMLLILRTARAQTPAFAIAQWARRRVEALRRAKELHRTPPTEATPDELRARAVLSGGNHTEPETAGAIPQI